MRLLTVLILVVLSVVGFAQENILATVSKYKKVNMFVRSTPVASYEVVGTMKTSSLGKGSKYQGKAFGAAGYNQITTGIDDGLEKYKKKSKGIESAFDGVIADKAGKLTLIKLDPQAKGAGQIGLGADANVTAEKKTGKLIFYVCRPRAEHDEVGELTYRQGGLGETMRGVTHMDVAINGLIDRGLRQVKKGEMEEFDGVVIAQRALDANRVIGTFVKFK